jgi:hypothetical protein
MDLLRTYKRNTWENEGMQIFARPQIRFFKDINWIYSELV